MSKIICLVLFGLVVINQVKSECSKSDEDKVVGCLNKLDKPPTDKSKVEEYCKNTVPKMKSCTKDAKHCLTLDTISKVVDIYDDACAKYNGAPSGFVISGALLIMSLVLPFMLK